MSAVWIASIVLQWLVIALLCVLVLALVRQVTALSRRPAGGSALALDVEDGPALGAAVLERSVELVGGARHPFGGAQGRPSLVVFVSPSCRTCESVPGFVRRLREVYAPGELELLVVAKVAGEAAAGYVRTAGLEALPVATLASFPPELAPAGGMPFAYSLTADGHVAARAAPHHLPVYHELVARAVRYSVAPGEPGLISAESNHHKEVPA